MHSIMQFSEKISRLIIRRKCCIMNLNMISEVFSVEVSVVDRVEMKKTHPCGAKQWQVLRPAAAGSLKFCAWEWILRSNV